MLVGALTAGSDDDHLRNVGIVWDPQTGPGEQMYVKRNLVPFGEYIPMRDLLAPMIGRLDEIPRDFEAGDEPGVLDLGPVVVGDAMCYDVAFEGVVAPSVRDGAELLVVQTNNATYLGTGQPDAAVGDLAAAGDGGRAATWWWPRPTASAASSPPTAASCRPHQLGRPDRAHRHRAPGERPDPGASARRAAGVAAVRAAPSRPSSSPLWARPDATANRRTPGGRARRRELDPGAAGDRIRGTVLVVIPTYDEVHNVEQVVRGVRAAVPDADVLVVDDASPDGTGEVADALAAADPQVHVLHRAGKQGLGAAYRAGFGWGLDRGYDVLVEMDADGSHQPEQLPACSAGLDTRRRPVAGLALGAGRRGAELAAAPGVAVAGRQRLRRGCCSACPSATPPAGSARSAASALERIDLDQVDVAGLLLPGRRGAPGGRRRAAVGRGADRVRRARAGILEDERRRRRRGALAGHRRGAWPTARSRYVHAAGPDDEVRAMSALAGGGVPAGAGDRDRRHRPGGPADRGAADGRPAGGREPAGRLAGQARGPPGLGQPARHRRRRADARRRSCSTRPWWWSAARCC